jgi:hypothetical protein
VLRRVPPDEACGGATGFSPWGSTQLGFTIESWEELSEALWRHAADNEIVKIEDSPFGRRYIIEGELLGPAGKVAVIRSVWFIEAGEQIPRFVTAYPLQRRGR